MHKLLKIFLSLVLVLVLIIIIAGSLLVTIVNPNHFKQQVSQLVLAKTGRTLTIKGDISWSFFPWLGLRLDNITLSNSANFATSPAFATAEEADISIRVLPLLTSKIELGELILKNASLNLISNAQGTTNWQDLQKKNKPTDINHPLNSSSAKNKPLDIGISVLDIQNASIHWLDEKTGQTISVENLSLKSRNIGLDKLFPVQLSFDLQSSQPQLTAKIEVASKIKLQPSQKKYQLSNLIVNSIIIDQKHLAKPVKFILTSEITADLQRQTLSVKSLSLTSDNLQLQMQLQANHLSTIPVAQGEIQLTQLNLKNLLQALNIPLATQDVNALENITYASKFTVDANSLQLNQLQATIDGANLSGAIAINNFKTYTGNFNLIIDNFDIDRYLPLKTAELPNTTPAAKTVASKTTNSSIFAKLRTANINGSLKIANLQLANTPITNLATQILANNGIIKFTLFTANVFQGRVDGQAMININGNSPQYAVNGTLNKIDIASLTKSSKVTGLASLTTDVTLQGNTSASLLKTLTGHLQFVIENGVFHGIDLVGQLNRAYALLKQQAVPKVGDQTDFGKVTGIGTFNNGIFNNQNLLMQSSTLRVKGHGTVNLLNQALNYRLQAVQMHTITNANGSKTLEPRQTEIPLLVSGTIAKPVVTPDLSTLAATYLKGQVGEQVGKLLQSSGNVGKALQNTLNGLFK